MDAEPQFVVQWLGDVVRLEAYNDESGHRLFMQFDADTAERVGQDLAENATLAREEDEGPRPKNSFGVVS
jgi:hypothetical protein